MDEDFERTLKISKIFYEREIKIFKNVKLEYVQSNSDKIMSSGNGGKMLKIVL